MPKLTLDKKEFWNCGKFNMVESKAVPTSIASEAYPSCTHAACLAGCHSNNLLLQDWSRPLLSRGYTYLPHLGANQKSCKIQYRYCTDTSAFSVRLLGKLRRVQQPLHCQARVQCRRKTDQASYGQRRASSAHEGLFLHLFATGNYERCTFTNTKVQYFQTSPAQQVGRLQQNCTESELEYEVRWKTEHSEENSFGVKLKGEIGFKIGEAVKAGVALELAYEHKWVDTVSFDETTRIKVPPGKVGGIYLSSGNVTVTGDFRLVGDDMIYLLNDVHVTYPIDGTAKDPFGKVYEPIVTSRITGDAPCGESTK